MGGRKPLLVSMEYVVHIAVCPTLKQVFRGAQPSCVCVCVCVCVRARTRVCVCVLRACMFVIGCV